MPDLAVGRAPVEPSPRTTAEFRSYGHRASPDLLGMHRGSSGCQVSGSGAGTGPGSGPGWGPGSGRGPPGWGSGPGCGGVGGTGSGPPGPGTGPGTGPGCGPGPGPGVGVGLGGTGSFGGVPMVTSSRRRSGPGAGCGADRPGRTGVSTGAGCGCGGPGRVECPVRTSLPMITPAPWIGRDSAPSSLDCPRKSHSCPRTASELANTHPVGADRDHDRHLRRRSGAASWTATASVMPSSARPPRGKTRRSWHATLRALQASLK